MSKKEKQETKTGKKKIKTWQIVTAVFAVCEFPYKSRVMAT